MVCSIVSGAVIGIGGYLVTVEVDVTEGLPCVELIGYLSSEVKEAKERVRVALRNAGVMMPNKHYTINLSPAFIKKGGASFDLPIAIGILRALQVITKTLDRTLFIGELSLDGALKPIKGILPVVIKAKEEGITNFYIPVENVKECNWIQGVSIYPMNSLQHVIAVLKDNLLPAESKNCVQVNQEMPHNVFLNVIGQDIAKRAAVIAAAGFHNMLMVGPPGCGKTMIAKEIPKILPPMGTKEVVETSKIYSVAGLLNSTKPYINRRPFINPHHTLTNQSLQIGRAHV